MRSSFRHEQQSIRMALATVLHHSYDRVHTEYGAPRSQTTATRARGGRESNGTKYTAKIRKTPLHRRSSSCTTRKTPSGRCGIVSHGPCAAAAHRRRAGGAALSVMDPVPQSRVQWHTDAQRVRHCQPWTLCRSGTPTPSGRCGHCQPWTLCPRAGCSGTPWSTGSTRALRSDPSVHLCRSGGQVLELLQKIVTASLVEPVRVIAVPKISLDRSPQRSAVRRTQMAEQLVEVPTEPGYALAVLASKFFSRRELRGFFQDRVQQRLVPGLLSRTLTFQFCVVGRSESLQHSRSRQGSAASIVEQNVDVPVRRGDGGRGRSSRFPPGTGFNSVLWSRSRRKSGSSQWRSSRFSPETGFTCFIRAPPWCCG